jgi:glutaredoxin 3
MIYIWGKPGCPSCEKAKYTLDTHNIKYEYRQLGVDFEREDVIAEFPEARTFPQIVINGQKIGGYEQMVKYIEDTGYTGTGYSL